MGRQALIESLEPQRISSWEVRGGVGLVANLPDCAVQRENVDVFVGANNGTRRVQVIEVQCHFWC